MYEKHDYWDIHNLLILLWDFYLQDAQNYEFRRELKEKSMLIK